MHNNSTIKITIKSNNFVKKNSQKKLSISQVNICNVHYCTFYMKLIAPLGRALMAKFEMYCLIKASATEGDCVGGCSNGGGGGDRGRIFPLDGAGREGGGGAPGHDAP